MTTSTARSPTIRTRPAPRLHRSATDRWCCGVCGGVAELLLRNARVT